MKNLEISTQHRLLLESIIKENKNYIGHEVLLEKFVEAIYKKTYLIIGAIKDMSRLRRHLLIITDGVMEAIIKEQKNIDDENLLKKIQQNALRNEGIVSVRENISEKYKLSKEVEKADIVNLKEEIQRSENVQGTDELNDPLNGIVEKEIPVDIIDKLVHIVKIIDLKYQDKNYYKIFELRYLKKYPQSQIARMPSISQAQLCKRYVELIELVKESL